MIKPKIIMHTARSHILLGYSIGTECSTEGLRELRSVRIHIHWAGRETPRNPPSFKSTKGSNGVSSSMAETRLRNNYSNTLQYVQQYSSVYCANTVEGLLRVFSAESCKLQFFSGPSLGVQCFTRGCYEKLSVQKPSSIIYWPFRSQIYFNWYFYLKTVKALKFVWCSWSLKRP